MTVGVGWGESVHPRRIFAFCLTPDFGTCHAKIETARIVSQAVALTDVAQPVTAAAPPLSTSPPVAVQVHRPPPTPAAGHIAAGAGVQIREGKRPGRSVRVIMVGLGILLACGCVGVGTIYFLMPYM